jgi:Flp pilus assembly protein TadG
MRKWRSEKGAALLEAAMTIPLLLLVAIGTLEFGRAYQTWQVLTNAAREGARMAVLPNQSPGAVIQRVRDYMQAGQLPRYSTASVTVNSSASITVNGAPVSASQVTVDYPFNFIVLQPVARLVTPSTSLGSAITMRAEAVMRNEPD